MLHVFSGMRVADFSSGMAGPMAAMVLADNGAHVVKVESPEGDWARSTPGFQMWNRGKSGVVLDFNRHQDIDRAQALAASCDVLIEDIGASLPDKLSYESLRKTNPGLVYCSLRNFLVDGIEERPGSYEGIIAARSCRFMGLDALSGAVVSDASNRPVFLASPIGSYSAAILAVQGISGALLQRAQTGAGMLVTTSLLDGLAASTMRLPYRRKGTNVAPVVRGGDSDLMWKGIALTFMTAECADGRYLLMCSRQDHHFRNWLKATGLEEFAQDPRYAGAPLRFQSEADLVELEGRIRTAMKTRTQAEWIELFSSEYDVGADPVLTFEEFLKYPQLVENGQVVKVQSNDLGAITQLGPLVNFSGVTPTIGRPAPHLGEHQREIEHIVPRVSSERAVSNISKARGSKLPFDGVTILELAYFLAAPFGAALLAENGARVIKVEAADGDPFRRVGLEFSHVVHGKESIAVDLKRPEGREVLHRLIKSVDVVLHSFRPGAVDRLGADYDTLRAINPRLIYVYGSPYGSKGARAGRPAFHSTPHAISGAAILQAGRGNPPVDDSYGDPCAAVAVSAAIAMGLLARERHGIGQYIETSMLCSTGYVHSNEIIDYAGRPHRAAVDSQQCGFHALYRLYRCQRGWLFLAVLNEQHWQSLSEVLNRPEWLARAEFRGSSARLANDEALGTAIQEVLATRSAAEWERVLAKLGIPAEVADSKRFEEFLAENGVLEPETHRIFGEYFRLRPRLRFSAAPNRRGPACLVGDDTVAILSELGYTELDIQNLLGKGVVCGRRGDS